MWVVFIGGELGTACPLWEVVHSQCISKKKKGLFQIMKFLQNVALLLCLLLLIPVGKMLSNTNIKQIHILLWERKIYRY